MNTSGPNVAPFAGMYRALLAATAALTFLQTSSAPPRELGAEAVAKLSTSRADAGAHSRHLWRDTPPWNAGGTVNAYVEIPKGERRKFEFDMKANARKIDRVMPESLGGYPINYGFVPQTVSYDGDPFDALVLGPALPGGRMVRGAIAGLMLMEDEKGLDAKVVLSPLDAQGKPLYVLDDAVKGRVADFFNRYKQHEPGKFSKVPGWGSPADAKAHIDIAHAFFQQCATITGPCRVSSSWPDSRLSR